MGGKAKRRVGAVADWAMADEPDWEAIRRDYQATMASAHEIARRGVAILLVEQKLSIAMRISHRVYVMGHGRIVYEGTPAELTKDAAVKKEWLEV